MWDQAWYGIDASCHRKIENAQKKGRITHLMIKRMSNRYYEQQLVNVFSKHFLWYIFLSFTGIIKDVKLKKWQPNKKEISMW